MNEQNEDPVATLIRAAGKRPQPSLDAMQRVRAAVEGEWRGEVTRRKRTRWTMAAVAAVAAMIVAVFFLAPRRDTTTIQLVDRTVETKAGETRSLDWNGNTLRLDGDSRVVLSAQRPFAKLERGTLYFSSEPGTKPVRIETPFGDVRDVGTQFEIRLLSDRVHVRVREGRVELRDHVAEAGEVLVATRQTVVTSRAAGDWSWVERAAPPIRLEGMHLDAVLHRIAREKGLTLDWHAPASARAITLRGNTPFTPDEALDVATAAARLTWRVAGDRLVIEEKK